MKKRVADLTEDVTRLQNGQDRLEERLAAVELRNAQLTQKSAQAPVAPQPDHPPLAVVRVAPGDAPPAPEADGSDDTGVDPGLDEELDDGPRPVIRATGEKFETSTTGSEIKDATRREYTAALGLVRGKQYKEAAVALTKFASAHSRSVLADNAVYWAGECEYALGRYEDAAQQFRDVIQHYPKGNKVPDALLKLGMSLARLGHADDARASFARLSQNYPDAAAARRIPQGY